MDQSDSQASPDAELAHLRRRYRELELRVTRFSAVEQELILARQRLDRQVTIHKRIQDFNAAAFRATDQADFATRTAEALVDIFEVEVSAFIPDLSGETSDDWGLHGLSPAVAGALARRLKKPQSASCGLSARFVPHNLLAEIPEAAAIKQLMIIDGTAKDGSPGPLLLTGNTHTGARVYEPLQSMDLDALVTFAEQVHAHMASRRDQEQIASSLREKEALLKEIHHRVKNNLQVVMSLLRLEVRSTTSTEARSLITALQSRVRAMALLHETIYKGESFVAVRLDNYLGRVASESFRLAVGQPNGVKLRLNLGRIAVEIGQATACGLILNELVSNALKHAFPTGTESGLVEVTLAGAEDGKRALLQLSDNGIGLPAEFRKARGNSLGLQLVEDLVHQLGGELVVGPPPAASFAIRFHPRSPQSTQTDANPMIQVLQPVKA